METMLAVSRSVRGAARFVPWCRGSRSLLPLLLISLGLVACGGESADEAPGSDATAATAPDFDLYLADLEVTESAVQLGELRNLTNRVGYDNQPSFTPDGQGILFTAADEAGQADILRYDLGTGQADFVTTTHPESEYSATPLPTGDGFSAIRVEADSAQRLWRFDWNGENPAVVTDLAPAGYHAWFSDSHVAVFVLGSPPTLVGVNLTNGDEWLLEESVGRSIQAIPGRGISWVATGGEPMLIELEPSSGATRPLIAPVGDGHDHAWTPDGTLLMADGGLLYWWRVGASSWEPVSMVPFDGAISRLAVSPDGTQLVVVGER